MASREHGYSHLSIANFPQDYKDRFTVAMNDWLDMVTEQYPNPSSKGDQSDKIYMRQSRKSKEPVSESLWGQVEQAYFASRLVGSTNEIERATKNPLKVEKALFRFRITVVRFPITGYPRWEEMVLAIQLAQLPRWRCGSREGLGDWSHLEN